MSNTITLTSKMGSFEFDSSVVLSHAKLIRDAITTQFFNPQGGTKIRTAEDVKRYIRGQLSEILSHIDFDVIIQPKEVT